MTEEASTYSIQDLSPHLFWDVDRRTVDWEVHDAFIITRVMEYGQLQDWSIIKRVYGLSKIKEAALSLRSLDDFSIAFLSLILDVKKENFRCYKLKQSQRSFWDY